VGLGFDPQHGHAFLYLGSLRSVSGVLLV